jgi:hypothetical protein
MLSSRPGFQNFTELSLTQETERKAAGSKALGSRTKKKKSQETLPLLNPRRQGRYKA